jgi:hypothetical protein
MLPTALEWLFRQHARQHWQEPFRSGGDGLSADTLVR